jgi:hypothetical protein
MQVAHPKANIRRTFFANLLCFDFMADILTIELRFRQQVVAEVLKNSSENSHFAQEVGTAALVPDSSTVTEIKL